MAKELRPRTPIPTATVFTPSTPSLLPPLPSTNPHLKPTTLTPTSLSILQLLLPSTNTIPFTPHTSAGTETISQSSATSVPSTTH